MSDDERKRIYEEMALIAANLEHISREGIPTAEDAAGNNPGKEACV